MYIHMYIYVSNVYIHMYTHMCSFHIFIIFPSHPLSLGMSVCIYMCKYSYIYTCRCIYVYTYVHICVLCIYINLYHPLSY